MSHSLRSPCHAFALVLALAAFALPAVAQQKAAPKLDVAQLQNKASRLPMLAERITKLYTQVGQNVLGSRTARNLPAAVAEFESVLKELVAQAPTPEIKENYQLLEQLWGEYRAIAQKPPNLDSARVLAEQNEEVVWIATKGAQLVQDFAKSNANELIRTAGEVRVLSQRIAKLYLFRSWGIRSEVIANDLKSADAEFRKAMSRLLNAPQNTPEINAELQLAENQYIFLGQAIQRLNTGKNVTQELEFVAKTCDNILEVMDRATRLYEGVKS
jgi:hypothetical protein